MITSNELALGVLCLFLAILWAWEARCRRADQRDWAVERAQLQRYLIYACDHGPVEALEGSLGAIAGPLPTVAAPEGPIESPEDRMQRMLAEQRLRDIRDKKMAVLTSISERGLHDILGGKYGQAAEE